MKKLLVILGPTAVGKTDYSIQTAISYGSPVISCDSRQIYKEMSIGTAVPTASQLSAVKHYFIHSIPVTETYTAGKYELDAISLINKLFATGWTISLKQTRNSGLPSLQDSGQKGWNPCASS